MILADANERIDHPFETANLPVGDFVIEGETGKVLVERKTYPDFVSSFRSGHLFNQLRRMMEQPHMSVLVCEGNFPPVFRHTRVNPGELRRYMSSIVIKWDITMAVTATSRDTVLFVQDVEDWMADTDSSTHAIRPVQAVPDKDRPRYIVEGLPGVGPKTAERLLDEFGTPIGVFLSSTEDLQRVDGIGESKAMTIYEAVRS